MDSDALTEARRLLTLAAARLEPPEGYDGAPAINRAHREVADALALLASLRTEASVVTADGWALGVYETTLEGIAMSGLSIGGRAAADLARAALEMVAASRNEGSPHG